jgi:hypothetical protein
MKARKSDEALLKWFKQQRSADVPVNNLMVKAKELARPINYQEFLCSAGWIDRCKLHHIFGEKTSSKTRAVNREMRAQ